MTQPSTLEDPNQPAAKQEMMVSMSDYQVRMAILQLCHNSTDTPDDVVKRARRYLKFLSRDESDLTDINK